MRKTIYQAGPLFCKSEQDWHRTARTIFEEQDFHVIWPGDLLTIEEILAAGKDGPRLIYDTCKAALERSDIVVALLDGPQVDDGTAWEVGYSTAKGIPVFGIRTDIRLAGETGHSSINSVLECCLSGLATSVHGVLVMIRKALCVEENGK
jgi:nucleoside 2-deoxyribosyltransferase